MESSLSQVTSPDFKLFVLEQKSLDRKGGAVWGSIADLGYIHQDWIRSENLCVLTRTLSAEEKAKIANRSLQTAKEKTKIANRSLQTLSARPTRFPVAPEGKMPDTPWTWSDLDTLAEPGNMPY